MNRLVYYMLVTSLLSCTKPPKIPTAKGQAQFNLLAIPDLDYDHLHLNLKINNQDILDKNFPKNQENQSISVLPGKYNVLLEAVKSDTIVASTAFCSEPNATALLDKGENIVDLKICNPEGKQLDLPFCGDDLDVGRRQLRLLTKAEIGHSIKDLIGVELEEIQLIPQETRHEGFKNLSEKLLVTDDHGKAYLKIAEAAAKSISERMSEFISCDKNDQSCFKSFLTDFGMKVWRRNLEIDEIDSLMELKEQSDKNGMDGSLTLLTSLFFSPDFLYRLELGDQNGSNYLLNDFELASSLSYILTGSTPDDELLAAAQNHKLQNKTMLMEQAERLFKSSKNKNQLSSFVHSWLETDDVLGVNKDLNIFPEFDRKLRQAFYNETSDFFNFLTKNEGSFSDLFLADFTLGGEDLQKIYGGDLVEDRLNLPENERRGILGHGSVLASHSNSDDTGPVKRGVFVFKKLLCEHLPLPPDSLDIKPPPRDPEATTRKRFAEHSSNKACAVCHNKIDGIGFGMEDFNPIGKFRTLESEKDIDASGKLYLNGEIIPYTGSYELSELLSEAPESKLCFVEQAYQYSHGILKTKEDQCAIKNINRRFTGQDLKSIWMELILSPSFKVRR